MIILGSMIIFYATSCTGLESKKNIAICDIRAKLEELDGRHINLSGFIVTFGPERKAIAGENCPDFTVIIIPESSHLEVEMEKGIIDAAKNGNNSRAFFATLSGRINYMKNENLVTLTARKMRDGQVKNVRSR